MIIIKELLKCIYVWINSNRFKLLKKIKLQNKITFLVDFKIENKELIDYIIKINPESKIIEFTKKTNKLYKLLFLSYHLTTSKLIVVDNYFPILSTIYKKQSQKVINIWHANGAIKSFGLNNKYVKYQANKCAIYRYKKVYNSYDYFLCANEQIATSFSQNYQISNEKCLVIGDLNIQKLRDKKIKPKNQSKILFYAPTFRTNKKTDYFQKIKELEKYFGNTYKIVVNIHPREKFKIDPKYQLTTTIGNILVQADLLITDYSNIYFTYSNIHNNPKVILWWDDYEDYNRYSGIDSQFILNTHKLVYKRLKDVDLTNLAPIKLANDQIIEKFDYQKVKNILKIKNF